MRRHLHRRLLLALLLGGLAGCKQPKSPPPPEPPGPTQPTPPSTPKPHIAPPEAPAR